MKALYQAVLRQKNPIQLGDSAYLQAHYEPAVLQQGGRVIKPPRYVWLLHPGCTDSNEAVKIELEDASHLQSLEAGIRAEQSFEWAPLGMFFKRESGFELLLASASTHRTGPNYGLPSLNLQPVKVVKANSEEVVLAKNKQSMWWLKVAAVILLIVLLNVMALTYLSEHGGLNFRQIAKVSLFDSLSEPDSFESVELPAVSRPALNRHVGEKTQVDSTAENLQDIQGESNIDTQNETNGIDLTKESVYAQHFTLVKSDSEARIQTNASNPVSSKQVAVVVGAFQSAKNAKDLIRDLKIQGYDAQELASTTGKWHRVVVLSKQVDLNSSDFLEEVRKNIHPQAWVLAE